MMELGALHKGLSALGITEREADAFLMREGGDWREAKWPMPSAVHAIRAKDGRVWDAVNGLRDSPTPKPRDLTIVICTPCNGQPMPGMSWSVANAMAHLMAIAKDYPSEVQVAFEIMGGSNLAQQRQQLVSRALNMKATHILFWDADIKAPADCIPRMLNHSAAMVVANYPTKEIVSRPTVYLDSDEHTGPLWTKAGDTGLVRNVARCGLGLALIDAQVFWQLDLPWFHFEPQGPEYVVIGGEDHYFCDKVRAAKIPIVCDQDLSQQIAHIGYFEYTNEWAVKAEETRQGIYNGDVAEEKAKAA